MGNMEGFDPEANPGSTPVPGGKWYVAAMIESETKPTKSGTGKLVAAKFEILEGEHAGRHVGTRFNIENPNEVAQRIGRGQLADVCRAVGVLHPSDTSELHDKPLMIFVIEREWNGDITNDIKRFKPRASATGAPKSAPPSPAGKPAWACKPEPRTPAESANEGDELPPF